LNIELLYLCRNPLDAGIVGSVGELSGTRPIDSRGIPARAGGPADAQLRKLIESVCAGHGIDRGLHDPDDNSIPKNAPAHFG
jgi:hypothetical protein